MERIREVEEKINREVQGNPGETTDKRSAVGKDRLVVYSGSPCPCLNVSYEAIFSESSLEAVSFWSDFNGKISPHLRHSRSCGGAKKASRVLSHSAGMIRLRRL